MAAKNLAVVRSAISNKAWNIFLRKDSIAQRPRHQQFTRSIFTGQSSVSRCTSGPFTSGLSVRLCGLCHHHGSVLEQKRTCQFLIDITRRHHSSVSSCASSFVVEKNRKCLDNSLYSSVAVCDPFLESNSPLLSQWRGYRRPVSHHSSDKSHRKQMSKDGSGEIKEAGETEVNKNKTEAMPGPDGDKPEAAQTPDPGEKLTLYQRFKKTYKEHGKVLIVVHLITSSIWFGSFYTAARCGIDIVPYLESWGLSEKVIAPFRSGGLGDVALAYLMYKLATPARYTVTIGGTNLAIRYLRKEGKMKPVPKEDSLRSLYKEGKEDFKRKSTARIRKLRRRSVHMKRHPPKDKH